MAESSYTDDADAVSRLGGEAVEDVEDGCASTHERSGMFRKDGIWDLEDVVCLPDCVGGEGSLVKTGIWC